MHSEVKATKAEAVAITATGVRIHLRLNRKPSEYFEQWFHNPKDFASTTRFHPSMCSFPSWTDTGYYIIIEVSEDAIEDAVRMVKEWIPLANEYAEKKIATYVKRRHAIEMKRNAYEEEQKKRLDALNEKLSALNEKLNRT